MPYTLGTRRQQIQTRRPLMVMRRGLRGLGDVTAQQLSTATYVLGQNTYATVAVLAGLIQDPFYGLNISNSDALAAAAAGMAAYVAAQNPGVPASAVISVVNAQGNSASIASVNSALPAPTLPTSGYMAPNPMTASQITGQAQMAAASAAQAATPAAQAAFTTQSAAAQTQYNVPVPTGYMVAPNTGIMTSGNPAIPSTMAATAPLGTTAANTALLAGSPTAAATITPQNTVVIAQAAGTPVAVTNTGAVVPVTAAAASTAAANGTPVTSGDIMLGTFDLSQFLTGTMDGLPGWAWIAGGLVALMLLPKLFGGGK